MSEVTISRSLRQSKDTSTQETRIDNPLDQDENKRALTQYTFETFPTVDDASANGISSNDQLCLSDTVHKKRDATFVAEMLDEVELQADTNCSKGAKTDQLPVQSNNLKDNRSINVDDIEPTFISEKTLESKQTKVNTTKTLSAEESPEVKLLTINTVIPPLQVIHGNNQDRFEKRKNPTNESSLPVIEREVELHSCIGTKNYTESMELPVSIPKSGDYHSL